MCKGGKLRLRAEIRPIEADLPSSTLEDSLSLRNSTVLIKQTIIGDILWPKMAQKRPPKNWFSLQPVQASTGCSKSHLWSPASQEAFRNPTCYPSCIIRHLKSWVNLSLVVCVGQAHVVPSIGLWWHWSTSFPKSTSKSPCTHKHLFLEALKSPQGPLCGLFIS